MWVFLEFRRWGLYLVVYSKGGCLFCGLFAMNSLRSNLRASGKPRLISSSLYPLSVNFDLNLSMDTPQVVWVQFCANSWDTRFLLWTVGYWFGVAMTFDDDTVMCQLVCCIFWYLHTFESLNLLPLYTEVSRNVISLGDVVRLNPGRLWKLFAVWKSATSSAGTFSLSMYPLSLKWAWVLISFLRGEFSDSCSRNWYIIYIYSCMSHISGDRIAPMEAPIVWW